MEATVETTKDVLVIGSGILGCAIAYELSRRGWKTINIDKLPMPGYGSTSSSSTVIRFHYSTHDGVLMAHESLWYWQHWQDYLGLSRDVGLARFINSGGILLKSDDGLWPKVVTHYQRLSIPYEDWNTGDLARHVPFYDVHRFGPPATLGNPEFFREPPENDVLLGALFSPEAGYVHDPQLATRNLYQAACNLGAEFVFGHAVVDIIQGKRVEGVVLDNGQHYLAPVVVNAAGPYSSEINRMAGVDGGMTIKTRPLRQEVHVVPAPSDIDFEHQGFDTSDGDLGIYFRPHAGNVIMVGSENPPCDAREWVADPDDYDRQVTSERFQLHVYRLARRIPQLTIPRNPSGLADLYDVSDDWIPIYDRSDLPGFYMAVGTSGNQFKNAPVVGRVMAELIEAQENGWDHDTDPYVVSFPTSRHLLNVGFFSRRRVPNPESTNSVNG